MKTKIFILLVFINCFNYTQPIEKIKDKIKLTKPVQITTEVQLAELIQFIVQHFGKSFKYYNELKNGNYIIEYPNESNIQNACINIINSNSSQKNNIIQRLHLHKKLNRNGNVIYILDKKEMESLIDNKKLYSYKKNDSHYPDSLIYKDSILMDEMILEDDEIPSFYWKILNRDFIDYVDLQNQHGEDAVLFKNIKAGIVIPYLGGDNSKILILDNEFHSILYFDNEIFNIQGDYINGYYGTYGVGDGHFCSPSGMTVGREYSSSPYLVYPIYIADNHSFRIVKVNFFVNEERPELSYFENSSFTELTKANVPYDISYYYDCEEESEDKLWVSESNFFMPAISCYLPNGTQLQRFFGYYDTNRAQINLFENNTQSKLCAYKYDYPGFGALAFIDDVRNCLVTCQLNPDGTGRVIPYQDGFLIVAHDVLQFPESEKINSVNFQATTYRNWAWPYLWVTSDNMIHCCKMNCYAHVQYLASTSKPYNSDVNFTNLNNTVLTNDFYDILTIEKWSYPYGIRRYKPFIDLHSDNLFSYCQDSVDMLKWVGTPTNECNIYLKVYRYNSHNGNWEIIKIDNLTGVEINDTVATKFEMAGWSSAWEDQDLIIKVDLPIEDYALGGQVKLVLNMFPESYNGIDFSKPHLTREYTTDIKKFCLPRPGGCPFLYVTDVNRDYIADNNILHRSEFIEGDITDKYKLRITPYTAENYIELSLVENENDNGYINMVKLYAVYYHSSKKMAITEDNQIVLYDSATVLASDSVTLNSTNITSRVNFHNPDTIHVVGYTNNEMYAHFTNPDMKTGLRNARNKFPLIKGERGMDKLIPRNRQKSDNNDRRETKERSLPLTPSLRGNSKTSGERPEPVAFIADLSNLKYPVPGAKYYAGELTATSIFSNQVQKQFARRELSSVMVLPLFADTDKVDNINIAWQSDFQMKYLGVTNSLLYEGYTSTEAPIMEGIYITADGESNITENLMYIDENYGEVSSSGLIKMKFDLSNLPSLPENYVRDYVIEVNGRYYRGGDARLSNVKPHEVPLTFKLSQNYPNPFNPVTKIRFEVPKTTKVNLVIYNVLGQEVKKLVNNEIKDAGRYVVEFDMTNYASGVYFYRIEAGSFVLSRKMVLIK